MSIGKRAKQRRKELNLDVPTVAKAAGIAPSTLYDLEREVQETTKKLSQLARALGLRHEYLEFGTGPRLLTDAAPGVAEAPPPPYLLDEAKLVGAEWQKLRDRNPAIAANISQLIDLLVAAKIREARDEKKPKKKSDDERVVTQ